MTIFLTTPNGFLHGTIRVAADKSISHRSLVFSALADGESTIQNLLLGEDVLRTLTILNQLGVITSHTAENLKAGDALVVQGVGLRGFKKPQGELYCGNSGTTMRLMLGLLVGQDFESVLTGDEYLDQRPMERVMEPLKKMGAEFSVEWQNGCRLIPILPTSKPLQGIDYVSPVASAQVKSALILAGLRAQGQTQITEPCLSRNHTETMLGSMGAPLSIQGLSVTVTPPQKLSAQNITVPGDISSAAFFIVGALVTPGSDLTIENVSLNPTRTGILDILKKMGADITIIQPLTQKGESVGTLRIRCSRLKNTTISGDVIPRLIDEIPILALAGAVAEGTMTVKDAQELRVKETDRIRAICAEFYKMGCAILETEDGFILNGGQSLRVPDFGFTTYGDHRIAMTLAMAGLLLERATKLDDVDCVKTSFPEFFDLMTQVFHKNSQNS